MHLIVLSSRGNSLEIDVKFHPATEIKCTDAFMGAPMYSSDFAVCFSLIEGEGDRRIKQQPHSHPHPVVDETCHFCSKYFSTVMFP